MGYASVIFLAFIVLLSFSGYAGPYEPLSGKSIDASTDGNDTGVKTGSVGIKTKPVISFAPNTIKSGENVTIIGSGFGAKDDAQPIIWDDFEWGNDGDDLDANPEASDRWAVKSPGQQNLSEIKTYSGTKAARWNFYPTDPYDESLSFSLVHRSNLTGSKEMYASYWVYTSNNARTIGKYARIQVDPVYSGNPVVGLMGQEGSGSNHRLYVFIANDNEDPHYLVPTDRYIEMTPANWYRVELYLRLSDPPGAANGAGYAAVDGKYIGAFYDNLITRSSGDNRLLTVFMLGQGLTYPDDVVDVFIDDVYLDNTRARVEIGDSSVWSGCSHREIQVPSAWRSDGTSVTFTVNQGSFKGGDTAYLFVVDADGNVSGGYPIIFENSTDSASPVLSNAMPSGTLAAGTSGTELSLVTNEDSVCRYSLVPDTPYSNMSQMFDSTGSSFHSTYISNLTNGRDYAYYIKCMDSSGNANTDDLVILFSVAIHEADLNYDGVISIAELMDFLSRWKAGENIGISEVLSARKIWSN